MLTLKYSLYAYFNIEVECVCATQFSILSIIMYPLSVLKNSRENVENS